MHSVKQGVRAYVVIAVVDHSVWLHIDLHSASEGSASRIDDAMAVVDCTEF